MPRLTGEMVKKAEKAASESGFTPLEPGVYRARLTKVDARTSSNDNPMWTWEFEVIEPPYEGRKQWNNTTLTDAAMWKVAETFSAFGVDASTDTDELIGCTAKLNITQRVIPTGARAGQTGNNVDQVLVDDDPGAVYHADSEHRGGGSKKSGTAKADAGKAPKKAPKKASEEF